ncbi:unnamed protein product [Cylicocyclus nassatus]|uniref:Apple domain-containing protein n=1 Tax=Cylicocyclus nassatus TaxID=53992 RepID=A0AA36M7I8_CYLNA|nr:unnamed protein product [Cylicocyclus nassatus]
MKFATLLLLAIQIGLASLCVFQREDIAKVGKSLGFKVGLTEAGCFAECLSDKRCTILFYYDTGLCQLYSDGDDEYISKSDKVTCYSLHRQQEKPSQYTKIVTFTRKDSAWVA